MLRRLIRHPTARMDAANTTTKKLDAFLTRPLRECALTDVPGVGEVAHAKLVAASEIRTAEQLLGQFMLLGSERMLNWLKDAGEIRTQEALRINEALAAKADRVAGL